MSAYGSDESHEDSAEGRHRYLGNVLLMEGCGFLEDSGQLCGLSYASSAHWSDQRHPFEDDGLGGCGWEKQNDGLGGPCAAVNDKVVVEFQKPVPGAEPEDRDSWRRGLVRPPDEDSAAAAEVGGVWDASALWSPVGGPEAVDTPEGAERLRAALAAEGSYWRTAVDQLLSEDVSLPYGPWPVRKYVVSDDGLEGYNEAGTYDEYLGALDVLGVEYAVDMWRPEGAAFRFALVTWDWARGLARPVVADELTVRYDTGA